MCIEIVLNQDDLGGIGVHLITQVLDGFC
jgi:hypothetical protein